MASRAQKIINLLVSPENRHVETSYPNQKDESPIGQQVSDMQNPVPYIGTCVNANPTAKPKQNDEFITANQDSNVPNVVPEKKMLVSSSSSSSSCPTGCSCSSSSCSSRNSSPDKPNNVDPTANPKQNDEFTTLNQDHDVPNLVAQKKTPVSSSSPSRNSSLDKQADQHVCSLTSSPSILIPQSQNIEPTSSFSPRPSIDYHVSPMNTDESDADISDDDPSFQVNRNRNDRFRSSSTSSTSSTGSANTGDNTATNGNVKSRKRKANPMQWKQNRQKIRRNLGESYTAVHTNKPVPARKMRPPCSEKCRLKCRENVDDNQRLEHFKAFWKLGDINLQRMFVASCITTVKPKYKYTNAETPRAPNHAFYIKIDETRVKVCKTFFINTFDISAKMIRTVLEKNKNGYVPADQRGKHRHHQTVNGELINDIKDFINSIPRIESHYLREATSREFISSRKSIAELFRDFQESQKQKKREHGSYRNFHEVFNGHFNIGFYQPKKDQCDLCLQYQNSSESQKLLLKEKYETHLQEKVMSREEKRIDRRNIDDYNLCVCYDVQAVMLSPNGETSSFYYKSKLNSINFTITELQKLRTGDEMATEDDYKSYGNVHCYFWDETQAKRGAIEIGSCVFDYLKTVSERAGDRDINIIFISDNCCGQNKNKYLASLYMFAVTTIPNLISITHKYLIKGHTQNEADNVHSLIQKQIARDLKTGPIYSPTQYIDAIRRARKSGTPFIVHSMTYDAFYDIKKLQEEWGYNFNVDEQRNSVVWNDIKVLKFDKETPFSFLYKTSYKDEFRKVDVRNKRKKTIELDEITISKAYSGLFELNANKKRDPKDLIEKKLIDPYHANYYRYMLG